MTETTFTQRAVTFEWPFGNEHRGQTVRFFDAVGPFAVAQWGTEWRVTDNRKANHRGGPANAERFNTRHEAEEFVRTAA